MMATKAQPALTQKKIHYPESDGKPMAETDVHRNQMVDLIEVLKDFFRDVPYVYVSGNLLLYYEEGNPKKSVAPDVFVVVGIPKRLRRVYLVWEEGKAPDVVIEVTSKKTQREDLGKKWRLYQQVLKVKEYFLYDPTQDYLRPPLQGYRLEVGRYVPIQPKEGKLWSEVLRLWLGIESEQLRLYRPEMKKLLTPAEKAEALQEAELARLKAELETFCQQRPPEHQP